MTAALLLACALLAAAPASLVPPGWSAKRPPADSSRLQMPAALARPRAPDPRQFPTQVTVSPAPARLGQLLTYRGNILVGRGDRVRFDRPAQGGEFTWGAARTGRAAVTAWRRGTYLGARDSAWIEVPLQVFATGPVSIPGPAVEILPSGAGERMVRRLPTANLVVLPTITAADSGATLRGLHGPLRAPWWERVPWPLVAAGALLAGALLLAIALLRRRRKRPPAPAPARPAPPRDPAAEALAELAKLRKLHLPEAGRFGDHALALTRILRRFLEAVVGTPRPGDTSGELVARLRESRLAPEDVTRLEGLLGLWDRVKFARAPLGIDEARRCEQAVEGLVRRREAREVA